MFICIYQSVCLHALPDCVYVYLCKHVCIYKYTSYRHYNANPQIYLWWVCAARTRTCTKYFARLPLFRDLIFLFSINFEAYTHTHTHNTLLALIFILVLCNVWFSMSLAFSFSILTLMLSNREVRRRNEFSLLFFHHHLVLLLFLLFK